MVFLVSIHAPARGATELRALRRCHNQFQSTRPRGARQQTCVISFRYGHVSIHAPARGATQSKVINAIAGQFQSTRPRGARPFPSVHRLFAAGFNPRARAGRDKISLR